MKKVFLFKSQQYPVVDICRSMFSFALLFMDFPMVSPVSSLRRRDDTTLSVSRIRPNSPPCINVAGGLCTLAPAICSPSVERQADRGLLFLRRLTAHSCILMQKIYPYAPSFTNIPVLLQQSPFQSQLCG